MAKRSSGTRARRLQTTPIPFGERIAHRRYVWQPPAGRSRPIDLEIGSPVQVGAEEWACPFRIVGLPKTIDTAAHGYDAVQAVELALGGAGALLSGSPQFRAGQIAMWDEPSKNAAALLLPLPLNSIQGTLENLRAYLERQQMQERKTKRDSFDPEWRRSLLAVMNEINDTLATLAAHLPIVGRNASSSRRAPRRRGR